MYKICDLQSIGLCRAVQQLRKLILERYDVDLVQQATAIQVEDSLSVRQRAAATKDHETRKIHLIDDPQKIRRVFLLS